MRTAPASFEARYREKRDPWGFADDPYERAKYARTIAALGARRFGRALELGCANGELTALLAPACDALVALDAAPTAVAQAAETLAGLDSVVVRRGVIPEDLPAGPWDLVVASEILYYLGPELLEATVTRTVAELAPGGWLLAVHWTGEAASHPLGADVVHARLLADPALRALTAERHPDYRVDLLERRPTSDRARTSAQERSA